MIGLKIIIILLLVILGVVLHKYETLKKDSQILAIAYKALYEWAKENKCFKDFDELEDIIEIDE